MGFIADLGLQEQNAATLQCMRHPCIPLVMRPGSAYKDTTCTCQCQENIYAKKTQQQRHTACPRASLNTCMCQACKGPRPSHRCSPPAPGSMLSFQHQVQARQSCNLFVQFLGEQIHLILVCLGLSPVLEDIELSEHLVREGARHYEGGVTCCTSQVAH